MRVDENTRKWDTNLLRYMQVRCGCFLITCGTCNKTFLIAVNVPADDDLKPDGVIRA